MRSSLTFLLFLLFCNISLVEARQLNLSLDDSKASVQDHCTDCEDTHCSDEEGCCKSICSCSHTSFYIDPSFKFLNPTNLKISSISWYYFSGYQPPSLEGDLRPPFYS